MDIMNFIKLLIAVMIVLGLSVPVMAATDITECTTLSVVGEYYNLINDNSTSGDCFIITANNITLDGNGHTITYANISSGYGVNISNRNNITIKNLIIKHTNTSVSTSFAFILSTTNNNTIYNNTVDVVGTNGFGIYLQNSDYNNISNNNVTARGNSGHAVILYSGNDYNIIKNNTLLSSDTGNAFRISGGNNNIISNGSIIATTVAYGVGDVSNTNSFINTNFTSNKVINFITNTFVFNYKNNINDNIWLNTSVSTVSLLTRKISNWTNISMSWNDTSSVVSTTTYNLSGLDANTYYNIYNISGTSNVNSYTLQTYANGTLPSFSIALNGTILTQIIVNKLTNVPTECSVGKQSSYYSLSYSFVGIGVINNTILINNNTNSLCEVFFDINDTNVISYNSTDNFYLLNENMSIKNNATLNINDTTLKFNKTNIFILDTGLLNINNSVITSNSNTETMGYIRIRPECNYNTPYLNLTNSTISYLNGSISEGSVQTRDTVCSGSIYYYVNSFYIFNNTFYNNSVSTIFVSNERDNTIIKNNTFYNNSNIISFTHGLVDRNIFYNNNCNYCIITWDNGTISNNSFYNNTIQNGGAIYRTKEGSSSGFLINNTAYNNTNLNAPRLVASGSNHVNWGSIYDNYINDYGIGVYISGNGFLDEYNVLYNIYNNTLNGTYNGLKYTGFTNLSGVIHGGSGVHVFDNIISFADTGIYMSGDEHADSYIYNTTISNSTIYDIYYSSETGNITPKIINVKYNISKVSIVSGLFLDYELLDVNVTDTNGNPISNASINFTNINDSNYSSINIEGQSDISFTTAINGHTFLPDEDKNNSIALLAFWMGNATLGRKNISYTLSVYDPSHLYTSTPTLIYPNGTLLQLSPVATATVSPNESWYRSNPNTYQNTTTITLPQPTNWSILPSTTISVNASSNKNLTASWSGTAQVNFNTTIPEWASQTLYLKHDEVIVDTEDSNATGFVSFSYTGLNGTFNVTLGAWQYNVSGFVNDSIGSPIETVSVVNGTNSTSTNATGYYTILMSNGTYNFSYTKAGYVTGYKEIIVDGADVVNQNVTLTSSASIITIPANSWGMFNNWSYTTNFSSIANNESNDVTYTFYNVTSGEWDSYYIGYSWNAGYTIDKNTSVLGFFNAETTIIATTVTPWNTTITEGWNMLYLMGTSNQTLTAICIDMVNCTDIYYYNSTTNDYVSIGTDTIQPNQGFLAYVNQTGTWIRSTI